MGVDDAKKHDNCRSIYDRVHIWWLYRRLQSRTDAGASVAQAVPQYSGFAKSMFYRRALRVSLELHLILSITSSFTGYHIVAF